MSTLITESGQKVASGDIARTIEGYIKNFTLAMAELGFDVEVTLKKIVTTSAIPQATVRAPMPQPQARPLAAPSDNGAQAEARPAKAKGNRLPSEDEEG